MPRPDRGAQPEIDEDRAQLGGNLRWALGSNFVLNGTVKPDFSQVEADATQVAAGGGRSNRVVGADSKIVFGGIYFACPVTTPERARIRPPACSSG